MQLKLPKRSASSSSCGKAFDRYFTGPYKELPPARTKSLEKNSSQPSITFPKIKGNNNNLKTEGEQQIGPQSRRSREKQIEAKISKEIALLRSGSKKKLQLVSRSESKNSAQNSQSLPRQVESWKDLERVAPSSGYLYIDCKSEPTLAANEDRKVTISSKWVMVTEPTEQALYSINQYAVVLKEYQCLNKITTFRYFRQAKIFRKWRLVTEVNEARRRKITIERKLKNVCLDVFSDLAFLFENIRKCKFISAGKGTSLELSQYQDYLFNSSLDIINIIHGEWFLEAIELCIRPIRESMLSIQYKEDERRQLREQMRYQKEFMSSYLKMEDELVEFRMEERLKRLRISTKSSKKSMKMQYQYLQSTAFANQFMDYFKVLKKCLYIYHEAYLEWTKSIFNEVKGKITSRLSLWKKERREFDKLMKELMSPNVQKFISFNPDQIMSEIQLISYECCLNGDRVITFEVEKDEIYQLLKQYIEYLMTNLGFDKMIESYAFQKHQIQPEDLKKSVSKYAQIELIEEIVKSNDCYKYQEILKSTEIKSNFLQQLQHALDINFQEVEEAILKCNMIIQQYYSGLRASQRTKFPAQTYEFLQGMKKKIAYFPRRVNIGLFAVSFEEVCESLEVEVNYRQVQIYENVPLDFRQLHQKVSTFLLKCYQGLRISFWSVDGMLQSYKSYEQYQEYKLSTQLNTDLNKLKGLLDVISIKCFQKYQECFVMYLQAKQLRERLDIKQTLFLDKLPKKLVSFKKIVDNLKESIWQSLLVEQKVLREISRESKIQSIEQKLVVIEQCQQRLLKVKQSMQKLGNIQKLHHLHFIEQDLTVNTHSYEKLTNDIKLLKKFINNYIQLQLYFDKLKNEPISTIDYNKLFGKINKHLKEINQEYLLLMPYQTILKIFLKQYENWKTIFKTIQQITYLKPSQLRSLQLFKDYFKKNREVSITLSDCLGINIFDIHQEVHKLKMLNLRVIELNNVLEEIKFLEQEKPFYIKPLKRMLTRRDKNKSVLEKTSIIGSGEQFTNKIPDFQGIYVMSRSLHQIKSRLLSLLDSAEVGDEKLYISVYLDKIEKFLDLFELFCNMKEKYAQIGNQNGLQSMYYPEQKKQDQNKMLLFEENNNFFNQYLQQKQKIKEAWSKMIMVLKIKSIFQIMENYNHFIQQINNLSVEIQSWHNMIAKVVDKTCDKITNLKFLDNSTVLSLVKNIDSYFKFFYPIRDVIWNQDTVNIITIYGQQLLVPFKQCKKRKINQLIEVQNNIQRTLKGMIRQKKGKSPIDNLANFAKEQLPFQIVYALDQIYLGKEYITNERPTSTILKNIQGEIKIICRTIFSNNSSDRLKYCRILCNQLIQSRIEIHNRLSNPENDVWCRNILILEAYEEIVCLRNFNTRFPCRFQLIDQSNLSFVYPSSEKMLVKICAMMNIQESLIIQQSDLIKNLSARLMSIYIEVSLSKINLENVLSVCQEKAPLFLVIKTKGKQGLLQVYEGLNRFQTSLKDKNMTSSINLPTIFVQPVNFNKIEISESLKLRFRYLSAVYPDPKIILTAQMITHHQLFSSKLYLDIDFIFKMLLIELKKKNLLPSHKDLIHICKTILGKLKQNHISQLEYFELLSYLFIDYFNASQIDFEKQIFHYANIKDRSSIKKCSLYQLVKTVVNISEEQIQGIQVTHQMKEYQILSKRFAQYIINLNYLKQNIVSCMKDLFELSFRFTRRPISIIGPHQSGKSLLLSQYAQFLQTQLGNQKITWKYCDVTLFNEVIGENISEQSLLKYCGIQSKNVSEITWIIFQGFIPSYNESLLSSIFSLEHDETDSALFSLFQGKQNNLHSISKIENSLETIDDLLKKMNEKQFVFELSELINIAPSYLSLMSKIYISEEDLDLESIFNLHIKKLVPLLIDKQDKNYLSVINDFEIIYSLISKLILDTLNNISKKDLLFAITAKSCLQRTLVYFATLFRLRGKKYLEVMYETDGKNKLYKLLTYSLYQVLQNFIDKRLHSQLQKMINSAFYGSHKDAAQDKYLQKLLVFQIKEIIFQEVVENQNFDLAGSNIYTDFLFTSEISLISSKLLKPLILNHIPVMVIGEKQVGKTTLIEIFLQKTEIPNLKLKGQGNNSVFEKIRKTFSSSTHGIKFSEKEEYIIFVEDVSMVQYEVLVEKYLRFIAKNKALIGVSSSTNVCLSVLLQRRRRIREQFQDKLWNTFIVNVQTDKGYLEAVFQQLFSNCIQLSLEANQITNLKFELKTKLISKQLLILKHCRSNFCRGYKTWNYDFSLSSFKRTLNDFISCQDFSMLESEEELIHRLDYFIYTKIAKILLQSSSVKELDKLYVETIGVQQFHILSKEYKQNYALFCSSIQRQNVMTKQCLNNVIWTQELLDYSFHFNQKLKGSYCILTNKVNLGFNLSAVTVVCEILNISNHELVYCEGQDKFMDQVEKIRNMSNRKGKKSVFYISLEEIKSNPDILIYIATLLQKEQSLQKMSKKRLEYQFIVEYSVNELELVKDYLNSDILKFSDMIHIKAETKFNYSEVTRAVIERENIYDYLKKEKVQWIIKLAVRLFEELKVAQIPKNIQKSQFHQDFLFSDKNFRAFIQNLLQTYVNLTKQGQNNKRMLEVNLGLLGYLFKQYKSLKTTKFQLIFQQSQKRDQLLKNNQQLRDLKRKFNKIKQSNILDTLKKNEEKVDQLYQQIQKIISSEKLWYKIHANAQKSITRGEIAQMKYLFMTTYNSFFDIFQLIALLLGQKPDIASIKRCFSDLNIVSKIKQINIVNFSETLIQNLQQKLTLINKKSTPNCCRTLIQWVTLGCRLALHNKDKDQRINLLHQKINNLLCQTQIIREKNEIDALEREISDLQKEINSTLVHLSSVQLKLKKTIGQINTFEKQFDSLISFEVICSQKLKTLEEMIDKMDSYCFSKSLEFNFTEVLEGQAKIKFQQMITFKLRKHLGLNVKQQQIDYFKLLLIANYDIWTKEWLLRPNQYLSQSKIQLIQEINKYLLNSLKPLAVLDPRGLISFDTKKNKAKIINLNNLIEKMTEMVFEECNLVIIQANQWWVSIKMNQKQFYSVEKFNIIKYKHIRLVIPARIPILFIMKEWPPQELLFNYKVINLQLSGQDLEEMFHYIAKDTNNDDEDYRQKRFKAKLQSQQHFFAIAQHINKESETFDLKNTQEIKMLTQMIEKLKLFERDLRLLQKMNQGVQQDREVSRVQSKIITLVMKYFPSEFYTSKFFMDIIEMSHRLTRMEDLKSGSEQTINLVIQFLTEGMPTKIPFLYIYYVKIISVQKGFATRIESQNLAFEPIPLDQMDKIFKNSQQFNSFTKSVLYSSSQMEKIYSKLHKQKYSSENHISSRIRDQPLSIFNQLIFQKLFTPRQYLKQIKKIVNYIDGGINIQSVVSLKKFQIKQNLLCICDASYWISKLKLPKQYRLFSLSVLEQKRHSQLQNLFKDGGLFIIFDDGNTLKSNIIIKKIIKNNRKNKSKIILLLGHYLSSEYQEYFKYISFNKLMSIFKINVFNHGNDDKSSYFMPKKILALKEIFSSEQTINEKTSDFVLWQKLKKQFSKGQKLKMQLLMLQIQWCYFEWNSLFNNMNKDLSAIIQVGDKTGLPADELVFNGQILTNIKKVLTSPSAQKLTLSNFKEMFKRLKDQFYIMDLQDSNKAATFHEDIFNKQISYKKQSLSKYINQIKFINETAIQSIEVDLNDIDQLSRVISEFDIFQFLQRLQTLLYWRHLRQRQFPIHLDKIQSQRNLFLLFENNIYICQKFTSIKAHTKKQKLNDPVASAASLQSAESSQQQSSKESQSKISLNSSINFSKSIGRRKSQVISQDRLKSLDLLKPQKNNQSFRRKSLIMRGQALQKIKELLEDEQEKKSTKKDLAQKQFLELTRVNKSFKNNVYVVDNIVTGLREVSCQEQLIGQSNKIRVINLLDSCFLIRYVEIGNFKVNVKETTGMKKTSGRRVYNFFQPKSRTRLRLE